MGDVFPRSGDSAVKESYRSVLARMVEAVSQDHAQMRALIYEFARTRLRKDLYKQFDELGWTGIAEHVLALEAAIDHVEAAAVQHSSATHAISNAPDVGGADVPTEDVTLPAVLLPSGPPKEVIRASYEPPILPSFLQPRRYHDIEYAPVWHSTAESGAVSGQPQRSRRSSSAWWTLQLIGAVILGVAIYGAIDNQFSTTLLRLGWGNARVAANATGEKADRQIRNEIRNALAAKAYIASPAGFANIPIPRAFGVYAFSGGELVSLDRLPIPVPDPRVAISAIIATPSRAHVQHGPIQFVIFRRELVSAAPDQVSVRVVAQLKRTLSFDSGGKPSVNNVDNAWVVRNKGYQMAVAPVPDNPEMIVVRSGDSTFALPAGRYALALKNAAYDFTVQGPIVDSAQCLERTDALNAPVYSECRTP